MIQRIQTLFLLLAAGAFISLFALPFATSDIATAQLLSDKIFDISDHVVLMVMAGLGGLLAIISIFLYKNRSNQSKIGYILIILGILIAVVAFMLFTNDAQDMPAKVVINDGVGAYMPIIAILAAVFANVFIKKDSKLVKSMDRLR